ncbi:MAG: GH3 auxin-responsive promoter family protein [Bacteroidetes bacterium]|nr:GH3 auxin-responsive promoter family protein [Bacteroidota bacterium]
MNNKLTEVLQSGTKKIPEILAESTPADLYGLAMESYQSPEEIQELVLHQILEFARETEFGRKRHFHEIKNVDDFHRHVPISEWQDYDILSDRMANGEPDILFPGKASLFITTTGTTGNKPKLIPESVPGAIARNAVMQLRMISMNRHFPGILSKGSVFPLSNYTPGWKTSAGIPVAFASGVTLDQSMVGGQPLRVAFPMAVFAVTDPVIRDYLLMRYAVQHKDVTIIAGNNAGRIRELVSLADSQSGQIIHDIETGTFDGAGIIEPGIYNKLSKETKPDPDRAAELRLIKEKNGSLLPKDYWPSLQLMAFWLSASVGHYISDVKPLTPSATKYMDMGYGASEGKFNIPAEVDKASGPLSLLTAFYEFIPVDGGAPLMAHQLENNKLYDMVITTWAGLYRYNLGDVIKVDGFTGKTPNIVFQYKSGEILNIAEEKIPASVVSDIIREMAATLGIVPVQIQIYPDETGRIYRCYMETTPDTAGFDAAVLGEKTELRLAKSNIIYNIIVYQHKLMNPLKIIEMKQGWQRHLYQIKTGAGQSSTQVKLPIMIKQKPDPDWIKE